MAKIVRKAQSSAKPAPKAANSRTSVPSAPAAKQAEPALAVVPPAPVPGADPSTARPENFACRWTPSANGGGKLSVTYAGPLAKRDAVLRFGVARDGGAAWSDTTEAALRPAGEAKVATAEIGPGGQVRAVEFVVRAGEEWDNGGRAWGYYEWRPDGSVAVLG